MKKPILFILALHAFALLSFSQGNELNVKVGARGLYIEHKVGAKENFYSIGREFNVYPRRLAAFNGLEMAKGLSLGQSVNIPLSDTNLNRNSGEGLPVYYQSSAKQTVGTISAISKTPSDNLRQLNHLSNDDIAANTRLVIGYLITGTDSNIAAPGETITTKPLVEEKKNSSVELPPIVQQVSQNVQDSDTGNGFFKSGFLQQVKSFPLSKEETVTAGIFKTTSGWNDARFYALIDNIPPGTIIKVINPNNNKEVYAKVLGQMSGLRQNQGLNLRISNAAASTLEIAETDKFIVKLNY